MTKRQAMHLPLLLPLFVLFALVIPAVLLCRVWYALHRYLTRVYSVRG